MQVSDRFEIYQNKMLLLFVVAPLIVALLFRRLYEFINYPNAKWPALAKYTRWWYLKKVYDGKFE